MIKVFLIMFIIGLALGLILVIAGKYLAVKEDKRFEKALSMMPGYNCGARGYPGCNGMINALLSKETDVLQCAPCKPEQRQAIVDYLNSEEGPDGDKLNIKTI